LAQCLQYLQFLQARQFFDPLQVAKWSRTVSAKMTVAESIQMAKSNFFIARFCFGSANLISGFHICKLL
jgi:hypothetical protein